MHGFQPVDSFARLALADIEKFLIPGAIRLVFVDGCYAAELSDLTHAGAGVTVASLAERFGDQLVEPNFGRHAPYKQDAFVALNTNFFEDGAWVHVTERSGDTDTCAACRDQARDSVRDLSQMHGGDGIFTAARP